MRIKYFTAAIKLWPAIMLLALAAGSERSFQAGPKAGTAKFRITGYLLKSDIEAGKVKDFDFSKINYLNIAFINPGRDGSFADLTGLDSCISRAHKNGTKVLASLGGGMAPVYYPSLLSDSMRTGFIDNILKLAVHYSFDGVDIDLEGSYIDSNYETFIAALSAALKQNHKILTAAVATVYSTQYTDRALAQMDFINIMSYDKTGPWRPSNPGQHSPYAMAAADLDYWGKTRGIAKEKLGLGMPFYGYGFGGSAPASISFKNIVSQYAGSENADSVLVTGGGTIYYNGIPTIGAKTALALQRAGGVMVWQLLQDAGSNNSLLSCIDTTISSAGRR